MNSKIAILGIVALFAVLTVSTASAYVGDATLYFNPQNSNVSGYGETVEVEVRANAPDGINNGQICVSYDTSCAKIVDVEFNPVWWMTNWNISTSECWGTGNDWIKYWKNPDEGPGDVWLFTITIKGNSTEYCETNLHFSDGVGGDCGLYIGNHSGELEVSFDHGTFACGTPPPPQTFEKELVKGWNLISLPLHNETDMTVANIIDESLSGSYDELYTYDASTSSFVSLSSTDTMENGVGYFINMTATDTWSYSGEPCESIEIVLSQGLNCVGWINETGSALPDALNSIDGDYNYVARWDANDPKYEVYDANAPLGVPEFIDFETMERGNGYWIAAKEGCTLSASCL